MEWVLELLEDEMRRIMVLLGAGNLSDLNRNALVPLNHLGERILKP